MNVGQVLRAWKVWVGSGLILLLAADVGLAVFLWKSAREGPQAMRRDCAKIIRENFRC